MGDDRFGFVRRLDGPAVEQDHRPHQAPADRGRELVACEQGGAVLEPHAALRAGEGAEPMPIDQHLGPRLQRNQASKGKKGDEK